MGPNLLKGLLSYRENDSNFSVIADEKQEKYETFAIVYLFI